MLTKIIFSGLYLLSTTGFAQGENSPGSNDPGFIQGIFDAETIEDQLGRKNCDGIRFYNAAVDDTVRVMAVSIERMADMNTGLFLFKPYIAAMWISKNSIEFKKLSTGNAHDACEEVDKGPFAHYSAHFTKSDLELLLAKDGCNALKLIPTKNSNPLSMEVHAVNFKDGSFTDLGQGNGFDLLCTDPCPPICGSFGNYVYRPR